MAQAAVSLTPPRPPSTTSDIHPPPPPPPPPPPSFPLPPPPPASPPIPPLTTGRIDDYRESTLKLEKIRHTHVYEAEKRFLYRQAAVVHSYQKSVAGIIEEYELAKRALLNKALVENSDKIRQVEELRYGILRDDLVGGAKKHEMSLRGRNMERDDELPDDKPKRRKDNNRSKVKLVIELDDAAVQADLAEMRGEKRRDDSLPDRRSKKRK